MHGTGQADINQAHLFRRRFQSGFGFAAITIEVHPQIALRIVIFASFQIAAGGTQPAIPEKGAKNDGVFQSFGFMYGHDLHQIGIRFEAELGGFVAAAVRAALLGQPADQFIQPDQTGGSLLQQFTQMAQIGQPTLAIGKLQEALRNRKIVEQGLPQDAKAFALRQCAVVGKACHLAGQEAVGGGDGSDVAGRFSHDFRCQRRQDEFCPGRLGNGLQQVIQFFRLQTIENTGLREFDTADAQGLQRLLDGAALLMAANQYCNITGLDGPLLIALLRRLQDQLTLCRRLQQAGNFCRRGLDCQGSGIAFEPHLPRRIER